MQIQKLVLHLKEIQLIYLYWDNKDKQHKKEILLQMQYSNHNRIKILIKSNINLIKLFIETRIRITIRIRMKT